MCDLRMISPAISDVDGYIYVHTRSTPLCLSVHFLYMLYTAPLFPNCPADVCITTINIVIITLWSRHTYTRFHIHALEGAMPLTTCLVTYLLWTSATQPTQNIFIAQGTLPTIHQKFTIHKLWCGGIAHWHANNNTRNPDIVTNTQSRSSLKQY